MPHVLTIMTLCSRALTTFWKRKMIVILSSRAFMKVVQLNNGPRRSAKPFVFRSAVIRPYLFRPCVGSWTSRLSND
jgi:hypothetical protein